MKKKHKFITKNGMFDFSEPYTAINNVYGTQVYLVIDVSNLIDYYSYHDAPSSVDTFYSKEDLLDLKQVIEDLLSQWDSPVEL